MSTKTISDEGESPEQKVQRQGKDDDEEVVDAVAVVGKIPASLLQSDDDNDGSNDSCDEIDSGMNGNNKSPVEFDDGDDDDDDVDVDDGGNANDEEGNEDDQDDDIVLAGEEDDNDGEGDVSADDSGSASDAEPAAASPSVMPRKSKTNNSASSYATTVVVPPVAATQKKRGKVKVKYAKRPKDFPKRPLSAYNIFFRETRKAMLVEKQNQLLTKGKQDINFQTTVKEIARRWRALPAEKRGRVERIAKADFARYKKEVGVFKDKARRLILREAIEQEKRQSQAEEEQKKNAIEKAATKAARGQQQERQFSNRRAAAAPPPPSPPPGRSSGSSRDLPTAAAGHCLTMDYQRLPQDGDQFGSSAAGVDGDAAVTPPRTINELCRVLEEDLLHIEAVREMKLRQLAELQVGIVPTNFLGGGGHPYDGLGSSLSPTTNHDPPPPRVTGRIAAALGRERDVSTIIEAAPEVELLGHRQLQEPEREAPLLLSYGGLADGDAALVGGSNIRGSAALRASRACLRELGLLGGGGGGGGGVAGVPGHPSYANPHSDVQFSAPLTRRRSGQEESIATASYQDCVRALSSQQDRLARQQQEDELLWRKIQEKKRHFLMSASSLTKEGLAGGAVGRGRYDAANQYDKQLKEYQQQLREYEVQHELELRHRGGTGIEFLRGRVALEQQDELLVRLEQEESVRRERKQQESLAHRRMVGGGGGDQHHHHAEILRKGYHGHLGGASPLMDSHYMSLNSSDDTIAEEEQRDRKRRRRRRREEEEHEVAAAAAAYQQQRLQELGDHYRRYEVRGVAATSSQHQERNYDNY